MRSMDSLNPLNSSYHNFDYDTTAWVTMSTTRSDTAVSKLLDLLES